MESTYIGTRLNTEDAFNHAIGKGYFVENERASNYVGLYMYMYTEQQSTEITLPDKPLTTMKVTVDYFKHIDTREYTRIYSMDIDGSTARFWMNYDKRTQA